MAAALSQAQIIESFHLAFLQVLLSRVDPNHVVLKGGANLRYFFEGLRYSEDIDFDVVSGEGWKLEEQVDQAIRSPALVMLLRSGGVSVAHTSKPKQTDTTQRWKLLLAAAGRAGPVATKVEFSRRNGDHRWLLEAVPDRVVASYGLRPPTVLHYTAAPATEQKVFALAGRREAQARDVFDLELLFRSRPGAVAAGGIPQTVITRAIERCLDLPFDAFEAQVVPFLDPEIAELYDTRGSWEQTQLFVSEHLADILR